MYILGLVLTGNGSKRTATDTSEQWIQNFVQDI
jgi:hypothetical protein